MIIIGNIIRRLIVKELFKMANEIPLEKLNALAQLVLPLVEKWGTKFIATIVGNAGIGWMVYAGKIEGLHGLIGVVVVTVTYMLMRDKQEKRENGGTT
jgi:lipoprotein signal peptidase